MGMIISYATHSANAGSRSRGPSCSHSPFTCDRPLKYGVAALTEELHRCQGGELPCAFIPSSRRSIFLVCLEKSSKRLRGLTLLQAYGTVHLYL